jgi:hypothetical protein
MKSPVNWARADHIGTERLGMLFAIASTWNLKERVVDSGTTTEGD